MKKSLFIVLFLALMGGAFAQNEGVTEYVSALITFREGSNVPQDSLNKYGVVIQTREGRMATALIPAEQYQAFLNTYMVERVQPSTRVFMRNSQIGDNGAYVDTPYRKHDRKSSVKDEESEGREAVRRHMIPEDDIRNDEAKGWYVGLMVGGSSNTLDVKKTIFNGLWYSARGLNVEARVGYQFNEWFGIRSGVELVSKNYATKLTVDYAGVSNKYQTYHQNQYLQLPLMADFSIGGKVRWHLFLGGYVGFWLNGSRNGVAIPLGNRNNDGSYAEDYVFNSTRDNRFDAGIIFGTGLGIACSRVVDINIDLLNLYGLTDVQKNYMRQLNPHYNTTFVLQAGVTINLQ
jgi:hypothetical protein